MGSILLSPVSLRIFWMPLGAYLNDLKSSDPPACVEEKTLKLFDRRTIAGQIDRRDLGYRVVKILLPWVVVLIWAHKSRLHVKVLGRIRPSIIKELNILVAKPNLNPLLQFGEGGCVVVLVF